MSNNVVVARRTVSCLLHLVWTGVLQGDNTDGTVLWIHVQSQGKTIPRICWINVSIPRGRPSTISHRLSKPTSCAATNASPRSPSQTSDPRTRAHRVHGQHVVFMLITRQPGTARCMRGIRFPCFGDCGKLFGRRRPGTRWADFMEKTP